MCFACSWHSRARMCPGYGLVTPNRYNALVTMHGTIMIFWVAMPVLVAAFGNFLIPLMIGCDDMVFPRINRLSVPDVSAQCDHSASFVSCEGRGVRWRMDVLSAAFGEGRLQPDALGASLWLVAVALEFVAFLLGGINFIVTTMNGRAPGMRMWDIPVVVWMIVIASVLVHGFGGPADCGRGHAAFRSAARHGLLRSGTRRRSASLAALVLVLRASGSVRGAAAGARNRGGNHNGLRAQEAFRIPHRFSTPPGQPAF